MSWGILVRKCAIRSNLLNCMKTASHTVPRAWFCPCRLGMKKFGSWRNFLFLIYYNPAVRTKRELDFVTVYAIVFFFSTEFKDVLYCEDKRCRVYEISWRREGWSKAKKAGFTEAGFWGAGLWSPTTATASKQLGTGSTYPIAAKLRNLGHLSSSSYHSRARRKGKYRETTIFGPLSSTTATER